MRVGYDVTPLATGHRWRGIGVYVRELLRAMLGLDGAPSFLLLGPRGAMRELNGLWNGRLARWGWPGSGVTRLGRQVFLPAAAALARVRVLHLTDFAGPALPLRRVVMSIHDVIALRHPELYGGLAAVRAAFRWRIAALRRADVVLANSECTRRDAIELCGLAPERVRVVYPGISVTPAEPGAREVRPYVLYVGGLDRKKNIPALLGAAARLNELQPGIDLRVVSPDEWTPEQHGLIREFGIEPRVRHLGYLPPSAELTRLYADAIAFVLPSHAEGMSYTVLEAASCGTPAVAFDNSSNREAVADGGLLAPDGDPGALAEAVGRLVRDSALRADLSRRATEHAAHFSWERAARETLAVYREIAG